MGKKKNKRGSLALGQTMLQLSFTLCLPADASGKQVTFTGMNPLWLDGEVMTPALSAAG